MRSSASAWAGEGNRVGSWTPDGRFLDVGEEGGQAVELAGFVRVELVVVALGAADGRREPDRRHVPHAVGGILGHVFLGLSAPLLGRLQQAVVARGDACLVGRAVHQVAGELLDREAVERLVGVERTDHVVAKEVEVDMIVAVIAGRVGEADQVEPEDRHPFAEMGRSEQPVDQPLVSIGPVVVHEGVDLGGRRGQADQVEAEPADQGSPVGLRGRLELLGGEPGPDEPIDFVGQAPAGRARPERRVASAEDRPSALSTRPLRRSSA